MILAIKTDVPESEVYILQNNKIVAHKKWLAHRQLSETIHTSIDEVVHTAQCELSTLNGIIFYEGPGSFTGLRIGCSVANALAVSYNIPIVATTGNDWLAQGGQLIADTKAKITIEPKYGSEPYITKPN